MAKKPVTPGPRVVLLHGLWMGRWAMWPLAHRLRRAGFHPVHFGYPSRARPADNAERLARWLADQPDPPLHFLAHSLGGLVLAHLFARHPEARSPATRVVLLGSPLAGSGVARRLGETRVGRWLLDGSLVDGLAGDPPDWTAPNTLMLAGDRPIGPGRLLPGELDIPNDGTVAVAETRVERLAAHRRVPVNHFALLWSGQVAQLAIDHLSVTDAAATDR
ncbi:alpha/beta hydrolase [Guyparkeria hydrothermalis]|uniref:esterase/lipase family protein n=1 Tax=Guyparkeria TaxID=2035712 RepID=UPI0010ABF33F|nr:MULTISPECIES: alpha/beta fold hydrolase [Guyparkeria]MCL7751132.1 alpha/beta hydrolase [Guyparkeria hydrothermalis]TKA88294.1 alpha/beta hydrolase [Guyparkeria sp. SB14A]